MYNPTLHTYLAIKPIKEQRQEWFSRQFDRNQAIKTNKPDRFIVNGSRVKALNYM